nr:hypothetical protein [Kibdelosporangium sp. MJ126-NF4]
MPRPGERGTHHRADSAGGHHAHSEARGTTHASCPFVKPRA